MLAWACLSLSMNAETPSEKLLFDLTTTTNLTGWQIVNDDVMGGVSTSRFEVTTNGSAAFSGAVSLENNGGFASVRSSPVRHSIAGLHAFVVGVRGEGKRYKLTVRTEMSFDAPLYQCASRRSAVCGKNTNYP
ncbi:MAG: Complex intermediate-associated protein 30 [Verrucomicrobiales bacterium]|nr:Complex intermediate-associated protein 30 [Verrucomicrobiales bacterium]